jgi:hypothetical protein
MKPNEYVKQPLSVAMALTGKNQSAAILFFDLWSFFSHSTVQDGGKNVLILSDDQLSERTGLSFDQARRAKAFLQKNGFIETWVKKDGKYHGGKTTTHIHIPDAVMTLVENAIRGTVQICTVGNAQNCIDGFVQKCALPLYIEQVSGNQKILEPYEKKEGLEENKKQQQLAELKELFK